MGQSADKLLEMPAKKSSWRGSGGRTEAALNLEEDTASRPQDDNSSGVQEDTASMAWRGDMDGEDALTQLWTWMKTLLLRQRLTILDSILAETALQCHCQLSG